MNIEQICAIIKEELALLSILKRPEHGQMLIDNVRIRLKMNPREYCEHKPLSETIPAKSRK